jgi:phosphatidyl-myo-inositol alpha-mannosyltransferase
VLDLAHAFQEMGHDATLVGPAGGGPLPQNGFTHHIRGTIRVPSPGDAAFVNINPLVLGAVREFLERRQFDVLHVHEPFLPFLGPSFLRLADGVKVGTFHTWRQGPHVPYMAFWPLIAYWNRRLDGRVAVSELARGTISRYFPGDYRVIPNGVDYPRFAKRSPAPAHLQDGRPTILFVGRIESRKGIQFLIQAYARLKRKMPEVRLVLIGEGGLKERFQRLAAELSLADVLFEGYVAPELLPGYYQRADVVCAPSTVNESFGITLVEAMAAGTPLVAADMGGFRMLAENDVNALLVPPKDVGALEEALQRLLEDDQLRERLSTAARERARVFGWDRVAADLLDYYRELGA